MATNKTQHTDYSIAVKSGDNIIGWMNLTDAAFFEALQAKATELEMGEVEVLNAVLQNLSAAKYVKQDKSVDYSDAFSGI